MLAMLTRISLNSPISGSHCSPNILLKIEKPRPMIMLALHTRIGLHMRADCPVDRIARILSNTDR